MRRKAAAWRAWAGVLVAAVCIGLVALPVAGVFARFFDPSAAATLLHLASTVLPRAAFETLLLVLLVTAGVAFLGTTSAWLVTAFDFPLRRFFEWALLLPLAMPAYIVAYAYTDFLQFAGPVQSALRALFGWQRADYWFPEIRSVPGAGFVFTVVLYPYVYLLARTAFQARTASMIEAARSLGFSPLRTWLTVNMPLARPAIAAGVLLALMETIADYGAVAYFGLQTFTTAIYRAWFGLGDSVAASQLAAVLLLVVLAVIALEERARGRARFFAAPNSARPAARTPLHGGRAAWAVAGCFVPLILGFVAPVVLLVRLLVPAYADIRLDRFFDWLGNTVTLGASAALLTLVAVLALSYAKRLAASQRASSTVGLAVRALSLGYAVPGAVIAVGILVPLAAFDNALDAWLKSMVGAGTGLLLTGSTAALLYAYLVRYFAVAHQPIEAGLARITPAMDASARSLGSTPAGVFFRVHLPLLTPSVLAATLLVFVDVMKELPATLVLRPFNFDTLAVVAYQFAADERLGEAALPALTIALVGVVPVIILSRAIRRTSVIGDQ
ncbi:MAG TPA: iron ABC transporter permease [Burkholderiaceae bacterium]|nr:iron ABC transporter permease [Burkholderiaceae bacterium]